MVDSILKGWSVCCGTFCNVFKYTLPQIHYAMTNRKPDILDTILEHPLNTISLLYTLLVCQDITSIPSKRVCRDGATLLDPLSSRDRIEENKPQGHIVSQKPPEIDDIRRDCRGTELPS